MIEKRFDLHFIMCTARVGGEEGTVFNAYTGEGKESFVEGAEVEIWENGQYFRGKILEGYQDGKIKMKVLEKRGGKDCNNL